MNAKKPFNNSNEINSEKVEEDVLEFCFNGITGRKEDNIINVKPESERNSWQSVRGIIWVTDEASVQAWIISVLLAIHWAEDSINFIISFLVVLGPPIGGQMVVTSSEGRSLFREVFLTLPCLRVRRYLTAILTRKQSESEKRMGAYCWDLEQVWSSWLPRTTMHDLVRGRIFSSFFSGKDTHGRNFFGSVVFTKDAILTKSSLVKVPMLLMEWFSSC